MEDDGAQQPESLLPYQEWTEEALRLVVVRALQHAARHGLPGGHHFYLSFRTDQPGVVIPARLRAQYPREMTIVLQHQFWDLVIDEQASLFSVGLSFGGTPASLTIPFAAISAFADPEIRYGLRFAIAEPDTAPEPETPPEAPAETPTPQIVSLDAFRRRTPPKE